MIIGSAILCLVSTFIEVSWFNAYHLSRYAFFFCAGMMIFKHNGVLDKSILVLLTTLISLGLTIYVWIQGNSAEKYFGLQMIAGLGISIGIIYLFHSLKIIGTNKFLIWISAYNLELYILHQYPVAVMTKVLPKVEWLNVFGGYAIGASASILVTILGIEIMRKIKLYDLCFKPMDLLNREKINNA